MAFLLELREADPSQVKELFARYRAYLAEIGNRLPAGARQFAAAEWHYDHTDHRCPHDSWVDEMTIREVGSGERSEMRTMEVEVTLLGAYHDGRIILRHHGVERYSLATVPRRSRRTVGHGDWDIDEIRLSADGLVAHEIVFSEGGRWLIECADVTYEWRPMQGDPKVQW